ncbi:AMP-binding protein [Solitalea lacus]|uniref:AMP-binding protein n=1 Tax=Solitalea lacus TaxID=2911172 RepID=UPI001EDC3BFC|nr:AMP-binding protein [Solitalea lacus]UKJ07213.1 AMP-binding protein [Solitalea lacus]
MKLLELVRANKNLGFHDLKQSKEAGIDDLIVNLPGCGDSKYLVFLYTNNSIESLQALFSFWNCEKAVIALFGDTISVELKQSLEQLYRPMMIADASRKAIEGYEQIGTELETTLYVSLQKWNYVIAPEVKLLLSTSGTTGSPKLVKLSERNVVENALSIIDYLPIQLTDRTPLNLPIHYSYGLSVLTTNAIAGGTIFTSVDDILNRSFWEHFKQYNFTSIVGVPFVYEMLNRLGFLNEQLPSLRYFTQAGGRLSEDLIEKFYYYSISNTTQFFVMYGQTEATARMAFLPPAKTAEKLGSIGLPIKNGQFSIDSETSELLYSGPNIFGGYSEGYSDLDSYHQTLWLKTGDLARMDTDGYVYITGRLKRFTKIAGNRVNLDELENHLKQHFAISLIACTNFEDKKLLIFLTKSNETETDPMTDFIREKFGIHHSLVKTVLVDEIPLTANGKTNYQLLQNSFIENIGDKISK